MDVKGTVLVVDDDAQGRRLAADALGAEGFEVFQAADSAEGLRLARKRRPHALVLDRVMPGVGGDEFLLALRNDAELRDIKIVLLSAKASPEERIDGLGLGADDYLVKPYSTRELIARVGVQVRVRRSEDALQEAYRSVERRVQERTEALTQANARLEIEVSERRKAERALRDALVEVEHLKNRLQEENAYLQDEIRSSLRFDALIGESESLQRVKRAIEQVAPTDASVLILGESGTGKELVARAIHEASRRKARALVKVNCAALPHHLIESELFGHQKGAFTGATARKVGRFELADGGTLFLDEVGELPLDLQAKLLRVLQEGELDRLGDTRTIRVDVRVLAATNRDLARDVERGRFRHDLYYRLNVFPIVCPPLRERPEDIPHLAEHLLREHAAKLRRSVGPITSDRIAALKRYHWPGNVRELENVIERALIISRGSELELEEPLGSNSAAVAGPAPVAPASLAETERKAIVAALEACGWAIEGKAGAARRLDMPPSTLRSRMAKLGIEKPTFR